MQHVNNANSPALLNFLVTRKVTNVQLLPQGKFVVFLILFYATCCQLD